MTLEKALSYAIDKEGIAIITEAKLANFLNDLQAFGSSAVKRIVSTMIDEGYFAKLQSGLTSDSYELQFNDVRSYLVQNEGFQADLVDYVLDCPCFTTCHNFSTSNRGGKRSLWLNERHHICHLFSEIFWKIVKCVDIM